MLDALLLRCERNATDCAASTEAVPSEGPTLADRLAAACIAEYQMRCRAHHEGWRGQSVVAGFVLQNGKRLQVVALGVGTKFMAPSVALADADSELLHDSHAEVLARRALRRYYKPSSNPIRLRILIGIAIHTASTLTLTLIGIAIHTASSPQSPIPHVH